MNAATEWGLVVQAISGWINAHLVTVLTIIIGATIAYLLGGWLVNRLVKKLVVGAHHRTWHRKDIEKRQKTLAGLVTNVWKILVVVVGVLTIVFEVIPNINLAPLFASAGIVGVALGFGAQSLIKDFLSGVFIISENQYRVGDVVEIEGASGTVERIGTRTTVLRDADGNVHYFPNGMLTHVVNKTMGYSMSRFTVAVYPSVDLDQVIQLINQTGEQLADEDAWRERVIEPPHFISIGEFTGSSVELLIAGKVPPSDQWAVTAEMRRRLLSEFEIENIPLAATTALGASALSNTTTKSRRTRSRSSR